MKLNLLKPNLSNRTRYLRIFAISIFISISTISSNGCTSLQTGLPPSSSSTPLDKKYPAAVLVGSEADITGKTVRNSPTPLPAGQPVYFSVRGFAGFGTRELSAQLHRIEQTDGVSQMILVYTNPILLEKGERDVLRSLPGLTPGNYQLKIFRLNEDIAARNFTVE